MAPLRTFLLVSNRALADGTAPLEDLPGQGGRFDLVTRFVTASLLTSHGTREDTAVIILFGRGEHGPVALRMAGRSARSLNPDERSAAALLNKALARVPMPVWQEVVPGVETRTVTLEGLLKELPRPLVVLDPAGAPLSDEAPAGGSFVIGDERGLTEEQAALVEQVADRAVSVGPVALQADQVAIVVHNQLDLAQDRVTVEGA